MKKGMGKIIFTFIFLLICGGAVFYLGWVQFAVPLDKYGVMISKTGGVHKNAIQAGNFIWRWERLLPTNTELRLFSSSPTSKTVTRNGMLPSGRTYSTVFDSPADFSYNITMTLNYRIKPEGLVTLVKQNNLKDQSELSSYIDAQASLIADSVVTFIINKSSTNESNSLQLAFTSQEILDGIHANKKFPNIDLISVNITSITIPDLSLYFFAKKMYEDYQLKIQSAMLEEVTETATKKVTNAVVLDKLSKLGKILEETPILLDFLKNSSKDTNEILKSIGVQVQ